MTAQVFRNGQTPTFYVSDALAPGPSGGVTGTFSSLSVTGAGVVFPNSPAVLSTTSLLIAPLRLDSPASATGSGAAVSLGGVPKGAISANSATASFDVGSVAGTTYDTTLFSNGVARLKIPAAGIASDLTAVNLLGVGADTTVKTRPVDSGVSTPVWVTVSGWVTTPTVSALFWSRNGNIVTCTAYFGTPTPAAGINIATISLPVARTTPFAGLPSEGVGQGSFISTIPQFGYATLETTAGTTTLMTLVMNSPGVTAGTIRVTFAYVLG